MAHKMGQDSAASDTMKALTIFSLHNCGMVGTWLTHRARSRWLTAGETPVTPQVINTKGHMMSRHRHTRIADGEQNLVPESWPSEGYSGTMGYCVRGQAADSVSRWAHGDTESYV